MRIRKEYFYILLLAGCGPSFRQIENDIDRNTQSINDIRGYQAEQASQIESLRAEIRNLTGRLDVIEHSSTNRMGSDLSALRNDLSTLKRRVPPPAIVPQDAFQADEVLVASLPGDISRLFSDGLERIREGSFEHAIPALRNALDLSYGKDWSANILFWLGIAYEGMNDNRNALASYNEIATRFSKHSRAPSALLRQSDLLLKLGDMNTARLTLKKLVADYPKSSEAGAAREKLKKL